MTDMQQLEIEVPSSPRHLPRVRDAVERCARNAGLSQEETEDIKVAASEAFANAIQHGSAGSGDSKVDVRIACRPGEVDVEIRDRGPGFDPSKVPPPDPEQERGRGIFLMRALADEVQFDDAQPGTRVILKEFHKTPSEAQKIEPRKQELCHEFVKIADERVEEFVEQVAGTLPRIDLLAYFFERPEAPHRVSELAERTGWSVGQIESASRHLCEIGVLEETAEAGEPAFRMTRRKEVREVVERFVRSISDPKNCYRIYYRVAVEEKEVIQQV